MIPVKDVIPTRTTPVVTIALVAINAFVFLCQLVPASVAIAGLATSMFIHTGVPHFVVNVMFLWIFGDNVEDRMGHGRFALFYLLCGVIVALTSAVLEPQSGVPIVGASGAIAGVMGAYFVLYPRSRVLTFVPAPVTLIEIPAVFFLGAWFVLHFLIVVRALPVIADGGVRGGTALVSHMVGLVTGAGLCLAFRRPERSRVEWWGR